MGHLNENAGVVFVVVLVALVALAVWLTAGRGDGRRRVALWFCIGAFVMLFVGVAGYVAIELVVGCHRGDSEYVDGQWRLWPLGNHCSFPATDSLPAEETDPGWGLTAAVATMAVLVVVWFVDAVSVLRRADSRSEESQPASEDQRR